MNDHPTPSAPGSDRPDPMGAPEDDLPGFGAGSGVEGGRAGTLARGLAVMDLLLGAPRPMTMAEIGAALGLDVATAMRLLRTLVAEGRAIRMGDGRRYAASPAALRPLSLLHPVEQVRREAAPLLWGLAERLRQSTAIVAFLGHERLVIDVALTQGSLAPCSESWLKAPLHCTGPGKALLMALDDDEAATLMGSGPYFAHMPDTLTTAAAVRDALIMARARGYVTVRDELFPGLTEVSAPFRTWAGRPAGCITVALRSDEAHDARLAELGAAVAEAARLAPLQIVSLDRLDAFVS